MKPALRPVPFVGGTGELMRKVADVQRTINMCPTPVESGNGKSGVFLESIPGLTAFSEMPPPPPPPPPTADFASADGPGDGEVGFTNSSSDATSYAWDFGDGSTSTATSPTHFYSAPGTYTVTLVATGPGGVDTVSISVVVPERFTLWRADSDWCLVSPCLTDYIYPTAEEARAASQAMYEAVWDTTSRGAYTLISPPATTSPMGAPLVYDMSVETGGILFGYVSRALIWP